jgi:hypothetical protein
MKRAILPALVALLMQCANLTQMAGGSSDSGNPCVTAVVLYPDGRPAAGAQVHLRRSDYVVPPLSLVRQGLSINDTRTDAEGRFKIDSIDTGSYCIEVNDNTSNGLLLRCRITPADAPLILPTDTLRTIGTIEGQLLFAPSGMGKCFVQVLGLERLATVDSLSGRFEIRDLPQGLYRLRFVSPSVAIPPRFIDSVSVLSGRTTMMTEVPWKFNKKIFLNTTVSGAGVAGTVTNFPLLVRLTSGNFDFSQARSRGEDLRFVKADGTPLPYEIERWDAGTQLAEVWVKIDTVFGNSNNQFFIMYWGNPDALSCSNGAAVFDTADGFAGVWHLDAFTDATSNADHGSASGCPGAIGIAGNARFFNDSTDYIKIEDPPSGALDFDSRSFSFSVWVYVGASIGLYDEPWWKGGTIDAHIGYALLLGTGEWEAKINDGVFDKAVVFGQETDFLNQWVYLSAVVDRGANTLMAFANGVPVDSADISGLGSLSGDQPAYIGRDETPFKGIIDEMRVESRVRSVGWIKLCYANQKGNDGFILYK